MKMLGQHEFAHVYYECDPRHIISISFFVLVSVWEWNM